MMFCEPQSTLPRDTLLPIALLKGKQQTVYLAVKYDVL
jgi:hypothetical protein